jgi:flagellar hook-associated protein 1 FlgK
MGTLISAFNISASALAADQAAIDITANNTANANTAGYTREVPVWTDNDAVSINGESVATGVSVTSQSQRDLVLQKTLDTATQTEQQSTTQLSVMTQISDIFGASASNNDTTGIGGSITSFFNSISSLQSNPSDSATRQGVLNAASNLASSFNSAASQVQQQTDAINENVGTVVNQINSLSTQIATLNTQISSTSPTGDAGTLEDQRQELISQLSQYVGLTQVSTGDNGITLSTTNGALLVSEGQSFSLSTSSVNGNTDVYSNPAQTGTSTDVTSGITGGQLGGMLQARDVDIPAVSQQLDSLAYELGTAVNTAQESGVDINGNAGTALFTLPSSATGAAAGISVAITDPDLIAAAATSEGASGNSNATAILNVGTDATVGGTTPSNYYATLVSNVGSQVSTLTSTNTAQTANVTQLTTQVTTLSGVSLDEEASDLTTYERAYQASAQVFSIINTLMASALNLGEQTTVS